jgi:hypothetical protein
MHDSMRLIGIERTLHPALGDASAVPISEPRDSDDRLLGAANTGDADRCDGQEGIRIMPDSPGTAQMAPACDPLDCARDQSSAPSEIAADRTGTSRDDARLMRTGDAVKIIRAADGPHYAALSQSGGIEYYRLESAEFRGRCSGSITTRQAAFRAPPRSRTSAQPSAAGPRSRPTPSRSPCAWRAPSPGRHL